MSTRRKTEPSAKFLREVTVIAKAAGVGDLADRLACSRQRAASQQARGVVQSERIDETAAGRTSLHKELLQVAQRDTRFGCYLARKVWWHLYVRDERLACRKCAALDYRSRHVRRRGAKSCAPAAPEARALQLDCWGRSRRSLRVDVVTIGLGPLRSSRLPKVGSLVCSTL